MTAELENRSGFTRFGLAWLDPGVDPEHLKGLLQPYSPYKLT